MSPVLESLIKNGNKIKFDGSVFSINGMILKIGTIEKYRGDDYRLWLTDLNAQLDYVESGPYSDVSQIVNKMDSLRASYNSALRKSVIERIEQ